ncbi:uncharacterized protein LOC126706637 isoform X2 [Quercus robur]|uniref:uncharacterized protein LOC126706637 isoform X2 n=1 Tax=Quercus robur TaxID=38942 RepID=UPI002162F188|nr:uncharacterized protein LOC126706637 isoform X2 [Quercus robur]
MPPSNPNNNVPYQFDHDSSTLASKLRNHQISSATNSSAATVATAIMLQQQLFMSRSANAEVEESGLIQMPLSLGASDDVVDGSSSFKSPNTVLIATWSQRAIEKEVETNKKMNIDETEKSANIIKILMK